MKKYFIGIDISKEKLSLCLRNAYTELFVKEDLINDSDSIAKLLTSLQKSHKIKKDELLICAEYTGRYYYPLSIACKMLSLDLWMENPIQIKYSTGVKRGKNDIKDSRMIASYACMHHQSAMLYNFPCEYIDMLKLLLHDKDSYVKDRAKYKGQLTDQKRFVDATYFASKEGYLKSMIRELDRIIDDIDKKIKDLIDSNSEIKHQYELLCSVPGVGPRIAITMIAVTNAFSNFECGWKFCCYAGLAPFEYVSGSSIHSKKEFLNEQINT